MRFEHKERPHGYDRLPVLLAARQHRCGYLSSLSARRIDRREHAGICPCRACGTQLRAADHKREIQTPYMKDGNTEYHSSTQHWPCSQCGDPKPLLKWHDNGLLVNAIVIAVLAVIAYVGYLKLVGPA